MAPGLVSIERQISAMTDRWPLMKLVEHEGRRATWVGPLQPSSREYRVRIRYEVPIAVEVFTTLDVQPRVQVVEPVLERHPDYSDGPIPHVYFSKLEPELPYLCLFDPYNGEWSPADLLAETTVPWTASYLYFYEGWLATKRWLGSGRHPTREEQGVSRSQRGKDEMEKRRRGA